MRCDDFSVTQSMSWPRRGGSVVACMKAADRYLATLAISLLLGCNSGGHGAGRADAGAVAEAAVATVAEAGPVEPTRDAGTVTDAPVATVAEAGPVGAMPDAGAVVVEAGPLRNVVMVVDDGFDPSVAELVGKVVASHTIVCAQSSADGGAEAGADPLAEGADPDFARAKSDLIAALREPDHS